METLVGYNAGRENIDVMSRRKLSISFKVSSASCRGKDQKIIEPRPLTVMGRPDYHFVACRAVAPESGWRRARVRTTRKTTIFMIIKGVREYSDQDQLYHPQVNSLKDRKLFLVARSRENQRKKDPKYEG
jgi:hypothetical protein